MPPLPIDTTLPADAPKNPHLRSSREITGYDIQAMNGAIGHVEDLVVDDETWTVRYIEARRFQGFAPDDALEELASESRRLEPPRLTVVGGTAAADSNVSDA